LKADSWKSRPQLPAERTTTTVEGKTMLRTFAGIAAAAATLGAGPVLAHFQSIYTPNVLLAQPGNITIDLIFWHPLSNQHVMNIAMPEEFFVVSRGMKTDLKPMLKPIKFTSAENTGDAFQATVPVRSPGDYVFGVVPAPFYEATEDKYIQQLTKMYVSRGGLPTDWNMPLGMKAEIIPLNRPNNVFVGSTFTGRVTAEGEPVACEEIEIEYIAAPPDVARNSSGRPTVAVPAAGTIWWGFAALGVGPDKTFMGKELSQDAVIWVVATEFK
jgi:cobalt/nickel transport protein